MTFMYKPRIWRMFIQLSGFRWSGAFMEGQQPVLIFTTEKVS